MIVTIHQPQYLPWVGYFDKIDRADVFVLLDNVQYKKNEWQNRNRIKTAQGWQWITVPVLHRHTEKITEVKINNTVDWPKKHLHALKYHYAKTPFSREFMGFFEEMLSARWERLVEINVHAIQYLCKALGIQKEILMASGIPSLREEPTHRLIDICKHLHADTYLSGKDGAKYMDLEAFAQAGVNVTFQDFHHPVYPQLYGAFEPCMSVVDLLFNCGGDSLKILRGQNKQ
ncbi:MAG: WbqC family protein [Planctomycetota bacterium]